MAGKAEAAGATSAHRLMVSPADTRTPYDNFAEPVDASLFDHSTVIAEAASRDPTLIPASTFLVPTPFPIARSVVVRSLDACFDPNLRLCGSRDKCGCGNARSQQEYPEHSVALLISWKKSPP
jgi:hypothetical protein